MIYLMIMIFSVFFALLATKKTDISSKIKNKFLYFLSYLCILLPHGLRYGIGTDYFYTYVPGFISVGQGKEFYSEIGFVFLNKIIYLLTEDYKVMFFITSAIIFLFIYKGIIDNSKNILISIILIFITQFYFSSMNLLRQAIAMSIIFYSFKYLKNNNKIKYVFTCLFATLFHNSALFMIALVFLYNKKITRKKQIIFCLSLLALTPILGEFIKFIITNYTKYGWYYQTFYATVSVSVILVIANLVLFILGLIYLPKDDDEYRILNNINFISMCLTVISPVIPLIFRVIKYFTIFQILFIPYLLSKEKKSKQKILNLILTLGMLSFGTIYQIFILGGEEVYPYVSIFG